MKKITVTVLICGTLLYLVHVVVNVLLVGYVASTLIPETAGQYGIDNATVEIVHVGLFETAVGPVRMGDPAAPFLDMASLKIRYTPWGLIKRHINQITISGITVNAAWQKGRLVLPGFSPKQSETPADEKSSSGLSKISWPVSIGTVFVDNAMINFSRDGNLFQIPLTLKLTAMDKTMNNIEGALQLFPCGQEIRVNARLDAARGRIGTRLDAPAIRLDSLADWAGRFSGLRLSGMAALSANADMTLAPLNVISATLDMNLSKGGITYQDIVFGAADERTPMSIKVTGPGEKGWQVVGSGAMLSAPLPLNISAFTCDLAAASGPGEKKGAFAITLDRSAEQPESPFYLLAPVKVAGTVNASFSSDNTWQVEVIGNKTAAGPTDLQVKSGNIVFNAPVPGFTLSAEGAGANTRAEAVVSIPRLTINTDAEAVVLVNGIVRGKADISQSSDKAQAIIGSLRLSTGKISADKQQAEIAKIDIDFPFQWPGKAQGQGKLAIGPLTWQGVDLGALAGTLRQEGRGAEIDGQYTTGLLPGLSGELTGRAKMDSEAVDLDMKFHLRHKKEAGDIDLGRFAAKAAGTVVNADLDATVAVAMNKGGFSGQLTSRIDDGLIRLSEKKMAITGIKADLTIPDLLTLKSDPDQKISFKKAAFGDIKATNGAIEFQLESARTIFIEKSAFDWCRGTVYAEGMRVSPDRDEYDLTLYSDRLNLAEVLNQIGTVQAEGEGTVSGRIPIRYAGGKISVNNGFLFSAPGEGGLIHLSKTDIFTAGLPKNSPQYSQIDLAGEALKNYRYDWAKVLLNSEGENLHIKLAFDGRPTRTLPFVYDKKKGGFVRDTDARQQSEFKGLSLDVNFTIPLNELIGYKGIWKR